MHPSTLSLSRLPFLITTLLLFLPLLLLAPPTSGLPLPSFSSTFSPASLPLPLPLHHILFTGTGNSRSHDTTKTRDVTKNDEDYEEAQRIEALHDGRRGWGYSKSREGGRVRLEFRMGEGWV
ncbi:hypothetical protein EX30DRAFT_245358 [Ascodesmis nigricans]|uniref:Uncharacterized protein n=1 Tax=Ascodesmis nigricans TaxID=341454 RepID=A0A4S2MIA4_9PEZI|nr:hypothetical protein EX30DRAFT_245358 [Ascodesmis nigricans]